MAADARIDVVIEGDNRPLKQTLSDTTSAIDKEAKNWDNATKQSTDKMAGSFESSLKRIAGAISAAAIAKKLLDFGKAAIDAASDLEEVQNVVDVTFGESAREIDAWAKSAINQFGLTETKAKQFASTLGAMMKSAGMSGDEIVEMSENLSGLAADMASFYNLDFDTAFQKIRSGISGETEPLKQLGINMSVANLEAFALQKGLKKTFDQMSQGEQTMLRYQYIMQATADAQGDFARTSDGYANGLRLLQSNFESIKTTIGSALIPVLATATTSINDFLTSLTQSKPRTVLDEIADIQVNTEEKIAKIQETANEAHILLDVLNELDDTDASVAMENLAKGANTLNANSPTTWNSLLTSLQKVDGLENVFKNGKNAGDNVKALADALSGASPDTTKAEAWQTFLGALSENVDVLTSLTGTSADETKVWLEEVAAAANKIDPSDAEAWDKLLTSFVTGLPGLADSDAGKAFFDALAQNFLLMGNESEEAKAGLTALGWSTDQISARQAEWLETCQRLVHVIPGLSDLIDTQTGEVKDGATAVKEYIDAWESGQMKIALWTAHQQKEAAVSQAFADLPGLQLDAAVAKRRARQAMEAAKAVFDEYGAKIGKDAQTGKYIGNFSDIYGLSTEDKAKLQAALDDVNEKTEAAAKAVKTYKDRTDELKEAEAALAEEVETLKEEVGDLDETMGEAGETAKKFGTEEEAAAKLAIENAEKSLKALQDYMQSVYNSTRSSVVSALGGFSRMVTPAEEARNKVKDLKEELSKLGKQTDKNKKEWENLQNQISSLENAQPSIQNITQALQSQSKYLSEYMDNLAKMKELGYSDQVIAMVSDGSAQSADYAAALAKGRRKLDGTVSDEVQQVNNLVAEVNKKTDELSSALTENKLAVDETAQELVTTWAEAVKELDKYGEANANVSNTMQGIIDGISSNADAVQQQVNNIISMMNMLSTMTYGMNVTGITPTSFYSTYKPSSTVVNTNLFLDSKPVANAVSEVQANQLETLDRSGFNP